jgi:hypothetical protein
LVLVPHLRPKKLVAHYLSQSLNRPQWTLNKAYLQSKMLGIWLQIDDFQPLEYLSEMRQVSIVFINLVLDEDEDETQLLQKIFEVIHTQTKAMHGKLYIVFKILNLSLYLMSANLWQSLELRK